MNKMGGAGTYNAADDGLDSASVAGIVAPVPDVSSLILFASGLAVLAGYVYVGRRRRDWGIGTGGMGNPEH